LNNLLKQEKKKYHTLTDYPEFLLVAEAINLQIQALDMKNKNKITEAFGILERAIEIEKSLPFGFGPPLPVKPSKELLADFYFEDRQLQKACETYQAVLLQYPNRFQTVEKLRQLKLKHQCTVEEDIFYHRLMNPTEKYQQDGKPVHQT